MWTHVVTAASARTVSVVSTGASLAAVAIVAAANANNTNLSNFAVAYNAAGDPTVTMAAFAANSICIGFLIGNAGAAGSTPPVGYTELYDLLPATNLRLTVVKDESATGTALSWVSASGDSYCYGLEIREFVAAAAGSVVKAWSGSAWVEKPTKVWDGGAWVAKPLKVWNGSAWV